MTYGKFLAPSKSSEHIRHGRYSSISGEVGHGGNHVAPEGGGSSRPFWCLLWVNRAFLIAQWAKNQLAMQETQETKRLIPEKNPLGEEMEIHSSILAWRTPWTEETGRLQSTGVTRVGYNWATKHAHMQWICVVGFCLDHSLKELEKIIHVRFKCELKRCLILFFQVFSCQMCAKSLQLCPTHCNPMDCSRPGWSGLPCPPPRDLPDPEIELVSPMAPALQADSLPPRHWGSLQLPNNYV